MPPGDPGNAAWRHCESIGVNRLIGRHHGYL
jgi:hypothetical protein